MVRYETVFILTPVLSEEQAKEAAAKFRRILTDSGCKILHEENWGLRGKQPARQLSGELLEVTKKSTGHYWLIEFEATGGAVAQLETAFKRDERVLRFMTIRLS
jgi:small subunit ribosomal protein S6